jgi:DNA-binding MarR family transcriptional regulator
MGWVNLGQAAHVVESAVDRRLESAVGVSGAEFELLMRLSSRSEQGLQMNEIANQLLSSRGGATRVVDRLAEAGLVTRETPAENRRAVYVRLTAKGRSILTRARPIFEQSVEEAFSHHLSDAEVSALRKILRRLLEGNGAWAVERCEPHLQASPAGAKQR